MIGVERDLRPWRAAGGRGTKAVVELAAGAARGVEPWDHHFLGTMEREEKIQELLEGAFPQAEAVKVIDRTAAKATISR